MRRADQYLEKHRFSLKLRNIQSHEAILLHGLKVDLYAYQKGRLDLVNDTGQYIDRQIVIELRQAGTSTFFIESKNLGQLQERLRAQVMKIARSLSMGNPVQTGVKAAVSLTLTMGELYRGPENKDLLTSQFQNTQNFARFLINSPKESAKIFQRMQSTNLHYLHAQPMLSSIALASFLQSSHFFNEKEVEQLFLASYFKDLGMSFIDDATLGQGGELNAIQRDSIDNHAGHSIDLLKDRLPISNQNLEVIRNHHILNDHLKAIEQDLPKNELAPIPQDFRLISFAMMDALTAMTSNRPHREGMAMFDALKILRPVLAEHFPQEFKALVLFLKNFLKQD